MNKISKKEKMRIINLVKSLKLEDKNTALLILKNYKFTYTVIIDGKSRGVGIYYFMDQSLKEDKDIANLSMYNCFDIESITDKEKYDEVFLTNYLLTITSDTNNYDTNYLNRFLNILPDEFKNSDIFWGNYIYLYFNQIMDDNYKVNETSMKHILKLEKILNINNDTYYMNAFYLTKSYIDNELSKKIERIKRNW